MATKKTAAKPTLTAAETADSLLRGQIEALLPGLIKAMADYDKAKAEVDRIKGQLNELIGEPKTVKTCWGLVICSRGRRTVKITDKALQAQITMMRELAVKDGRATESRGENSISFRKY